MKASFLKNILRLSVVFLAIILFGCAEGNLWNKSRENQPKEDKSESREPVAATSTVEKTVEVTLSSPVIRPVKVTRGKKVSFQMQYTLSSPDKTKGFDVVEVITLSGSKLNLELSRKTSRKAQGSHVLMLEFTIPRDLSPGPYKAKGTIKTVDIEKQEAADFTVKRR